MKPNGLHKISKGFETQNYQNMKKLNKSTKIGIAITPLLILCVVVCMLAFYSSKHPNETIIINKTSTEGFSFETDNGVYGIIYPKYELTLINAFRIKTISISKNEWDGVDKWQKYNTKHPLKMYY